MVSAIAGLREHLAEVYSAYSDTRSEELSKYASIEAENISMEDIELDYQEQELLQSAIGDAEQKLQSEQERLSTNTEWLSKLFAATESSVDDYADVLGSRLVNAIKSGMASSDQLKTAIEKIGKSATGGKADIKQLTDALDTVDDGQAIRNLIEDLNDVGGMLPRMPQAISERLRKLQRVRHLWKRLTSCLLSGIRYRISEVRLYPLIPRQKMRSPR